MKDVIEQGFYIHITGIMCQFIFLLLILFLSFLVAYLVLKSKRRKGMDFSIKQCVSAFREDNVSIIVFVITPLVAVALLYELKIFPGLNNNINRLSFYSLVFTIVSVLVTIMVSLQLIGRKVSTGVEFLRHLIRQLSMLKTNEYIYIITPNINLGFGLKHGGSNSKHLYEEFRQHALEKSSQVFFITYGLDLKYLNSYANSISIENYSMVAGNNNSFMIEYLYKRYFLRAGNNDIVNSNSYQEMIEDLKLMAEKIKIIGKYKILKESIGYPNICGYLTSRECLIGSYNDIDKKDGKVLVEEAAGGEKMNDALSIQIAKTCIEKIIGENIVL